MCVCLHATMRHVDTVVLPQLQVHPIKYLKKQCTIASLSHEDISAS